MPQLSRNLEAGENHSQNTDEPDEHIQQSELT